ncbi:hypothetical protein DCC85_14000 [Paenibacillus sp. CAA11]|uniref:DUF3231 family protein n=1 Tax=Paenibacillus sp. CAA11 TaxID=1532905 RepID=UPI000D37D1EC|nr:DUF3231 family protein [Paenibacillus sp. CAA11]AWB45229.1 hypothetical protein DCC85_14000 [Paenibacillus sp. CAA11]
MGVLDGKNEPMHYGEIYHVWEYSSKAKASLSGYQAMLNHAGDKDLKEVLQDLITQARHEIKETDDLLMKNNITPAPLLPERPEAHWEEIPAGARFSDIEIAMGIAADIAIGLPAISTIIGMCIREDVALMFTKYYAKKQAMGERVLRMNKDKGWLIPPPLHVDRPEMAHV